MSKYDPLRDYLRAQKHQRLSMSFAEIEKLGVSLPASAIKHRPWWANNKHHSQANAWLDAGYETQQVDMSGGKVTFRRYKTISQHDNVDDSYAIDDDSEAFEEGADDEITLTNLDIRLTRLETRVILMDADMEVLAAEPLKPAETVTIGNTVIFILLIAVLVGIWF